MIPPEELGLDPIFEVVDEGVGGRLPDVEVVGEGDVPVVLTLRHKFFA